MAGIYYWDSPCGVTRNLDCMDYYTGMVTMVLGTVLGNCMRFVGFGLNNYRFGARLVDHNHNLCLGFEMV